MDIFLNNIIFLFTIHINKLKTDTYYFMMKKNWYEKSNSD